MRNATMAAAAALALAGLTGCGRELPEATAFAACADAVVPNCRQGGNLTFGGQPGPDALRDLAARGYTTVVSTRGEGELDWDERALVESLGLTFVHIPMPNPVTEITDGQVARLDSALANLSGKALLHCSSGNRAAGLYGVWLAERRGVEARGAIEAAERAGMTRVRPAVEARLGR